MSEELRSGIVPTSLGTVWFGGSGPALTGKGPVVLMVAGAFRVASHLASWIDRLSDHQVMFSSMPGHGWAETLAETSVAAFTEAYREAILKGFGHRPILFVGESTAGLVGLGLNLPCVEVLAIDPPLSTAKLWPIHRVVRRELKVRSPQLAQFAWNILGVGAEATEERDYRGIVERVARPVSVLTGDVPLMPDRELPSSPSLLDADDVAVLRSNPLVTVHNVSGPHALLQFSPDACEGVIRGLLANMIGSAEPPIPADSPNLASSGA